jgi:hypothetical protein
MDLLIGAFWRGAGDTHMFHAISMLDFFDRFSVHDLETASSPHQGILGGF